MRFYLSATFICRRKCHYFKTHTLCPSRRPPTSDRSHPPAASRYRLALSPVPPIYSIHRRNLGILHHHRIPFPARVRSSKSSRTARRLHTEILALRQQVAVLKRKRPRPLLRKADRVFWVILSCLWPGWRHALVIVRPETVIGWHRKGFRLFWTWKSRRGKPGRPPVSREIRYLVRRMSRENTRWGAPRIHGELLKLGFSISQAAVSKYMVRYPSPPSQSWRTFLTNHADCLASIDFFVVPTATFHLLFGFIVLHHERRQIVHFGVTANPTMAWVAQQIREAFPWGTAPRHLIRDRDGA